jgi:addiction module RelB/DinJ family antitoxin
MSTALLNIKTDPKIKIKAQEIATDLGLDLNMILNAYLRHFVRTKTVFFSLEYEEPSDYLLSILSKYRKEYKKGDFYSFDKPDEAIRFLDKVSNKK